MTDLDPIWEIAPRQPEAENRLVQELGLHPLVATCLVNRGLADPAQAERFLKPDYDHLAPPETLPDYRQAADALLQARERKQKIYIHGDYDVDGVSATAILAKFLRTPDFGWDVEAHVPHREKEGYGIHPSAIHRAKELGAKLFLTCDCGSSAVEQLKTAYELGMTAVVTDHHEATANRPPCEAVVNPHRPDLAHTDQPGRELCGAGIAYKLCLGLARELGHKDRHIHNNFLDYAVLGTVADVMPLKDDNRVIVAKGLQALRDTKKTGLRALLKVANLLGPEKRITTRHIGFQLGPRINAVGRIDDSDVALRLFLAKDPDIATELATYLDQKNQQRRAIQEKITDEATAQILAENLHQNYVIVVAGENWAKGIVGIVAGKVVEAFRRPAFVLSVANGAASGSARSIPRFNLFDAIQEHRELLTTGGGHAAAAGVSLPTENVPALREALDQYARAFLTPEDFRPTLPIDAETNLAQANPEICHLLAALEPFGVANPEPVFLARNLTLLSAAPTTSPRHARLKLHQEGTTVEAMAFGNGEAACAIPPGSKIDVVFTMENSLYKNRPQFKLILKDFRPSSSAG